MPRPSSAPPHQTKQINFRDQHHEDDEEDEDLNPYFAVAQTVLEDEDESDLKNDKDEPYLFVPKHLAQVNSSIWDHPKGINSTAALLKEALPHIQNDERTFSKSGDSEPFIASRPRESSRFWFGSASALTTPLRSTSPRPFALRSHAQPFYMSVSHPVTVSTAIPVSPYPYTAAANHFNGNYYGNSHVSAPTSPCKPTMPYFDLLQGLRMGVPLALDLSVAVGSAFAWATDQYGSRFIQQCLEHLTMLDCNNNEVNSSLANLILARDVCFEELFVTADCLYALLMDVFGNYVVQRWLECGSRDHQNKLSEMLGSLMPGIACQQSGCRVLQRAFEKLDLGQLEPIYNSIQGHVISLVMDPNGNHVIQKCIEGVPTQCIPFMAEEFVGHVAFLAQHTYGCRVIQRIVDQSNTSSLEGQEIFATAAQRKILLDELLGSTLALVQDQYGNYVVQHVLQGTPSPAIRSRIIGALAGNYVALSCHKFASNVVEKCVIHGNLRERQLILDEILSPISTFNTGQVASFSGYLNDPYDGLLSLGLEVMVKDQFANYVVQKMLDVIKDPPEQRCQLITALTGLVPALRKFSFGKHILMKMDLHLSSQPAPTTVSTKDTLINQHLSAREELPFNNGGVAAASGEFRMPSEGKDFIKQQPHQGGPRTPPGLTTHASSESKAMVVDVPNLISASISSSSAPSSPAKRLSFNKAAFSTAVNNNFQPKATLVNGNHVSSAIPSLDPNDFPPL